MSSHCVKVGCGKTRLHLGHVKTTSRYFLITEAVHRCFRCSYRGPSTRLQTAELLRTIISDSEHRSAVPPS